MDMLIDGPDTAPLTVLLAHGAGAPMDTPFMTHFAAGIAAGGYRVARFEFPYMVKRREDGGKRPPDRMPRLMDAFDAAIDQVGPEGLVIGGKSMGGRVASLIAERHGVAGLVCLGYPFHPPGKPDKPRVDHLEAIQVPTLIVQGERDSLGRRDEIDGYSLSPRIHLRFLADGDHSFKPRKASGRTERQNWTEGVAAVTAFLETLDQQDALSR